MVRPAKYLWNLSAAILVAGFMMIAQSAVAATVGQAVAALGDDPDVAANLVGTMEFRPLLGVEAIKYFIPLGISSGTYGVDDFGLSPDSGIGGEALYMNLAFKPVSITQPSILKIVFEDLDLMNVNDPPGFLESIQVFGFDNGNGLVQLTPLITEISSLISGDADTQLLSLNLGVLGSSPYWVQLAFKAISTFNGTNTAEYLQAEISAVPLPAALPLFLTALAGLGLYRRRRQRNLLALQHA